MPLFRITGIGRDTGRKRVRVYETDTKAEAIEKANQDGTIVEVAATKAVPYPPPTDRQLEYAKSLGIAYSNNITGRELCGLIDEALKWASPKQINLAKELGLKIPSKRMTREEMSYFLDTALEDRVIRKRYNKLPPTEAQLRLVKEKGIKIPWFATRQKLSALIDKAIEEECQAAVKKRAAEENGSVRGRFISDKAALEALKDVFGSNMILPNVNIRTRINKSNKKGAITAEGDKEAAKQVRDHYAKLIKEQGFTVKKDSNYYIDDGIRYTTYGLKFEKIKQPKK